MTGSRDQTSDHLDLKNQTRLIIISVLVFISAVVFVRNAWTCDDAFITFRTIDNFLHGYGLTWNVAERVQSYTHPLWMFVLVPAFLLIGKAYYAALVVSILLSVLFISFYAFKFTSHWVLALLGILILLTSKPFVDFSVSGLENPLTHVLLALYVYFFLRREADSKKLRIISLIAALGAVNRLDTLVFTLPGILLIAAQIRNRSVLKHLLIGFIPLILWELFAFIYYGSMVPNTALAKLNTGVSSSLLMEQGIHYFQNAFRRSPSSMAIIFGAVICALVSRSWKMKALGLGILGNLLYVVKVGGDFMSGRFLSAAFVVGLLSLTFQIDRTPIDKKRLAVMAAVALTGLLWWRCPIWSGAAYGTGEEKRDWFYGISDERAAWYPATGLLVQKTGGTTPDSDWALLGLTIQHDGKRVVTRSGVGLVGYFAGPSVHIVDNHALTDPLLARLPTRDLVKFRIGHFNRNIPDGYLETLETGKNTIADSSLAAYYDKIRIITRGELLTSERLTTLINFHLGRYNYLLDNYLQKQHAEAVK